MTFAVLQRQCACGGTPGPDGECAACKAKRLQRRAAGPGPALAPRMVGETLRAPGRPLEGSTRAAMEKGFGHDFGRVRVHTDARAAESARAVGALAYTVGREVVFGAGRYEPETRAGRHLLAHELTHVLQQDGAASEGALGVRPADDAFEREGDAVSRQVVDGPPARTPVRVRRLDSDGIQRFTFGSGVGPNFGGGDRLVPVPAEHQERVDAALGIVSRVVNNPRDFPACPRFFEANCPGGTGTSLTDSFNRAVIWFNEGAPPTRGGVTAGLGGQNIGYTALTFRIGRWAMAASFIHELMHICGEGDHDIGDQAKEACGRLPDIIRVTPRIEISNPL